ncbi:MAG: pilus assembly protein TadG-related protein, partial [Pseudorhodoplanes sp.]
MSTQSVLQKLRRAMHAFRGAREGNVMTVFAVSALPLVGFVGAAVDYSNASAARTAMQMALDSTALMLSKEAAGLTSAQLNSKATSYFNALYTRTDVTGVVLTPTYTTTNGSQVTLDGVGVVKSSFMGIFGVPNIAIHGTSSVTWGQTRLRVALALDTTGSMSSDGKMPALKTAAKSLIAQLKDAAKKNGDVYVSIIPFSKDVNVGTDNWNAN